MKLATIETSGDLRAVAVHTHDGEIRFADLAAGDAGLPTSLIDILAVDPALDRTRAAAQQAIESGRFLEGTLRAPLPRPGKILCIGLNYRDHARESGLEIPGEPVCFGKFGNTIIGPDDAIRIPAVSSQVDYEAELVVVIGRGGYRIPAEAAMDHVAGYMNGHDVSARDWQIGKPGKQWMLGKTPDTFAPIGPWLVTADEIADPHALDVSLRLNGERMQQGNTREFIFGVPELIAYVSQIITLEPGDIMFTGTPPGVGMARTPPVFLKPGDEVEVEISGLGVLKNPVIAAS